MCFHLIYKPHFLTICPKLETCLTETANFQGICFGFEPTAPIHMKLLFTTDLYVKYKMFFKGCAPQKHENAMQNFVVFLKECHLS